MAHSSCSTVCAVDGDQLSVVRSFQASLWLERRRAKPILCRGQADSARWPHIPKNTLLPLGSGPPETACSWGALPRPTGFLQWLGRQLGRDPRLSGAEAWVKHFLLAPGPTASCWSQSTDVQFALQPQKQATPYYIQLLKFFPLLEKKVKRIIFHDVAIIWIPSFSVHK